MARKGSPLYFYFLLSFPLFSVAEPEEACLLETTITALKRQL